MEISLDSQLVTFGKYKGKPYSQALADKNWIEWVKNNIGPSLETRDKEFYKVVYNIQYITSNAAPSMTPEHNRMQNKFLDSTMQKKLIQKFIGGFLNKEPISNLIQDPEFIRSFGSKNIDEVFPTSYDPPTSSTKTLFEGEHNWDIIVNHDSDVRWVEFNTILETELDDKINYDLTHKEEYDTQHKQKIEEYVKEITSIENNIAKEHERNVTRLSVINEQLKEKRIEIEMETKRKIVPNFLSHQEKLTKLRREVSSLSLEIDELGRNRVSWRVSNARRLMEEKEKYEKEYDSTYNKMFETHQINKYTLLARKYSREFDVQKINEKQYQIYILIRSEKSFKLCFELKPVLGDDYPEVLRKLRGQIERTERSNKEKEPYKRSILRYGLIIGLFNSSVATKQELVDIFNQGEIKIRVLFMEDLLESQNCVEHSSALPPLTFNESERNERFKKTLSDLLSYNEEDFSELMRLYSEARLSK